METSESLAKLLCMSNIANIMPYWGYCHETVPKLRGVHRASNLMVLGNLGALLKIAPKKEDKKIFKLDYVKWDRDQEELLFRANHFKVKFGADSVKAHTLLLQILQECKGFEAEQLHLGKIRNEEELESANKIIDELVQRKFVEMELGKSYQQISLEVDSDFAESFSSSTRIKYLSSVEVSFPADFLQAVDKVFKLEVESNQLEQVVEKCSHIQPYSLSITWIDPLESKEVLQDFSSIPLSHSVKNLLLYVGKDGKREDLWEVTGKLLNVLPNLTEFEYYDWSGHVEMNSLQFIKPLIQPQFQRVRFIKAGTGVTLNCTQAELELDDETRKHFRVKDLSIVCKDSDLAQVGDNLQFSDIYSIEYKSIVEDTKKQKYEPLTQNKSDNDINQSSDKSSCHNTDSNVNPGDLKLRIRSKDVREVIVVCCYVEPFSLASLRAKIFLSFIELKEILKWQPMIEELEHQPLVISQCLPIPLSRSKMEELLKVATTKNLEELDVEIAVEEGEDWETVASLINNCSTLTEITLKVGVDDNQEKMASLIPTFKCAVEWRLQFDEDDKPSEKLQQLKDEGGFKIEFKYD